MSSTVLRTFRFSPPSTLSLDWLFEFHCAIRINNARRVVVTVDEEMTGHTQFRTRYSGEMWRLFLFVWHKCHIMALNHAFKQNTQDACASRERHLKKLGGFV